MNLKELMGVDDEGAKRTANVMTMATTLSATISEMVEMIRNELTGNERDLAMVGIGEMIEVMSGGMKKQIEEENE